MEAMSLLVTSETGNKVSLAETKECLAHLDAHECRNLGVHIVLNWSPKNLFRRLCLQELRNIHVKE